MKAGPAEVASAGTNKSTIARTNVSGSKVAAGTSSGGRAAGGVGAVVGVAAGNMKTPLSAVPVPALDLTTLKESMARVGQGQDQGPAPVPKP